MSAERYAPLFHDEPDVEVREVTRIYDHTLRHPAPAFSERWPIVTGFDAGAPVDMIATSLAAGWRWTTGPASLAQGVAIVWLPYAR